MLLPAVAAAGANRLVERIVARRAAEQLHVARPEPRRRVLPKRHFRHRHEDELPQRLCRPLRLRIERL